MTAALCSTSSKYKEYEKNQYSLKEPKIKMYYKQKQARSKSGKKQEHSIGNHWLNEGSAKGINHMKSRELLHLHFNSALYLFLRKRSYMKKQQCQTKCQPSLSFIL